MTNTKSIGVLGAGSWGTALAKHLADVGHKVTLWSRREEHVAAMERDRANTQYLPGAMFSDLLHASADLAQVVRSSEVVLSVIPAQETRRVWSQAKAHLAAGVPVLCASKGIENETLALMSDVLKEALPGHKLGFVAGPSFAKEVAKHLPTAIVIGSHDEATAKEAQRLFASDWMRAYISTDVTGLEVGGALKNVIAIACGCADGLGLGHNTRAAIITRGLAEITRMATKLGADPLTLAGLGGMGDLVLTCTGDLSRNRRVGIGLGQGKSLPEILKEMGQVAEGVETSRAAHDLARKTQVEMPIAEQVYAMLYENKPARDVVLALMRRDLKSERT